MVQIKAYKNIHTKLFAATMLHNTGAVPNDKIWYHDTYLIFPHLLSIF